MQLERIIWYWCLIHLFLDTTKGLYSPSYYNVRRESSVHFLLLTPQMLHLLWVLCLRNKNICSSVGKPNSGSMEYLYGISVSISVWNISSLFLQCFTLSFMSVLGGQFSWWNWNFSSHIAYSLGFHDPLGLPWVSARGRKGIISFSLILVAVCLCVLNRYCFRQN